MGQLSGRQHTRIDYRVPIELLTTRDTHSPRRICGHSLDLSEGGARIVAPVGLHPGDSLTCAIPLDGRAAHLAGQVVWVDRPGEDEAGVGIRWSGLGTRDSRALRHIVDRAREGYRRAELHFEGIEQPVFARAKATDHGVRLSVALPILDDDRRVSFRLDEDAPLLHGQIGDVAVEREGKQRKLRIDVDTVSDPAVRYRRHTQYGRASELDELERSTPAALRALAPDGTPIDLASPSRVPTRRTAKWVVGGLAALGGIGAGWMLGVAGGALESPPTHVVTPALDGELAARDAPRGAVVNATPPTAAAETVTTPIAQPAPAPAPAPETEPEPAPETEVEAAPEAEPATATEAVAEAGTGTEDAAELAPLGRPSARSDGETTHITIPFAGTLEGMRSRIWADPLAIALDLPGVDRALPEGSYRIATGGVKRLRLNRRDDELLVRVMLERPVESYSVNQSGGELQVHIAHRE